MNPTQPAKVGWRINEWAIATGVSRSRTYELLAARKIRAVKQGSATIIVTAPTEFLQTLPPAF